MPSSLSATVGSPSVTVWAAIHAGGIIGPFFFEGTVTGATYLAMLQSQFWPEFVALPNHHNIFFQQDGAPPHYALAVRQWLNEHLKDKWIGRRGPIDWPPRSPDLTPPDFFLWGFIKNNVFKIRSTNLEQLKNRIRQSIASIPVEMCYDVCNSVPHRYTKCVEAESRHFENSL